MWNGPCKTWALSQNCPRTSAVIWSKIAIPPILVLLCLTDVSLQIMPSHSVSNYLASEWLSMNYVSQFWPIGHESRWDTSGKDFSTPNENDNKGNSRVVSSGHWKCQRVTFRASSDIHIDLELSQVRGEWKSETPQVLRMPWSQRANKFTLPSLWQFSLWDNTFLYYLLHFELQFLLSEHESILTDNSCFQKTAIVRRASCRTV